MPSISSVNNDIIKQTTALHDKKSRDEYGLFIAEGLKTVCEIPDLWNIEYILCTEKYNNYALNCKNKYTVTENIFKKVSETSTPQGILAVIKKQNYDIENILNKNGIFIIIDRIQDPGNIGTIIRTAQAYNCNGIFTSADTTDVYSGKVVRSTMGAIFKVPVLQNININSLLNTLKVKNISVYALALQTDKFISDIKFKNNTAFIVGNEAEGISREILNNCENIVKIKMFGGTQSLNAATACSIAVYEAAMQIYEKHN